MGSFNGFLDAKFLPPRNWSLDAPLKFKSETLTKEERELLYQLAHDQYEELYKGDWDAVKEEISELYLIMHKLTKKEEK